MRVQKIQNKTFIITIVIVVILQISMYYLYN